MHVNDDAKRRNDHERRDQARDMGRAAIAGLRPDAAPIEIRTIRPATPDEIEFANWHHEMIARETNRQ